MRSAPELAAVLHAVGLPAAYNEEFVRESVIAIAAWKRWNQLAAAKWLRARAIAAQEAGTTVDKWWFVNGVYREDPRPRDLTPAPPLYDPQCRTCIEGWQQVVRAEPSGKVTKFVVRCACVKRVASSALNCTPGEPASRKDLAVPWKELGALANANRMP